MSSHARIGMKGGGGSIRRADALHRQCIFVLMSDTVSDSRRRIRQYVGLGLVICMYLGGIVGWSWAVSTVESESATPDTTQTIPSPNEQSAP